MDEGEIDWSFAVEHMWSRHMILLTWAQEAVRDINRLTLSPDPVSRSGSSIRIIGYSPRADLVLAVIIVEFEGRYFAASAWKANKSQARQHRYGMRTDE